jgi:hypothetical protein
MIIRANRRKLRVIIQILPQISAYQELGHTHCSCLKRKQTRVRVETRVRGVDYRAKGDKR